ncbi:MAG: NifU N-terminal domain-containing protein [Acidimicrobiales bacterium]
MGQPITVVEKATSRPGVVRFETNRSITGMGHERYNSRAHATGTRPPDELARRLFARDGVRAVHIYSNVVTVELEPGGSTKGMAELVHDLFIWYREGVTPSIP